MKHYIAIQVDSAFDHVANFVETQFFEILRPQVKGLAMSIIQPRVVERQPNRFSMSATLERGMFLRINVERHGMPTLVHLETVLRSKIASGCALTAFTFGLGGLLWWPLWYLKVKRWKTYAAVGESIVREHLAVRSEQVIGAGPE